MDQIPAHHAGATVPTTTEPGRPVQAQRPRRARTKGWAAVGTACLLSGAGAVSATSAQAWTWSGTVTVSGTAGCTNVGGIQQIDAEGDLDGKHFSNKPLSNGNQYSVTFTNVRSGRVPSGGGWAWVTVTCSMGGYHQGWVEMYRPSVGSTITHNF